MFRVAGLEDREVEEMRTVANDQKISCSPFLSSKEISWLTHKFFRGLSCPLLAFVDKGLLKVTSLF